MDTKAVIELVDELEENLEDLEDNLASILNGSLAATSRKLPLLDRAKLNVLLVYSIESLLFSYLKLHGAQVKEHPIFKELTRVKQYFEKIKQAETIPESARPTVTLNKEAATRVIKHGLAGNEKYDLERAEREAREKVLANRKLRDLESKMKEKALHNSNNGEDTTMSNAMTQAAQPAAGVEAGVEAGTADVVPDPDSGSTESGEDGEVEDVAAEVGPKRSKKRQSTHTEEMGTTEQKSGTEVPMTKSQRKKQKKKQRNTKKQKKEPSTVDS